VRLIKMFALAAIAVGAFTAYLGVTTASATSLEEVVLCKALEDPCLNGHFGSGTVLHGLATNPTLEGAVNITCATSHVLGQTNSLLAHGEITALSWLECEDSNENTCTVTTNNLNYLIKGELQSNHKDYEALVTAGSSGKRPSARVQCPGLDCSFGANNVLFTVAHTGVSGLAVLNVSQVLTGEGFICSFASGTWNASYSLKCLSGSSEVGCWPAMHPNVKL
jgi:hypothetical protein